MTGREGRSPALRTNGLVVRQMTHCERDQGPYREAARIRMLEPTPSDDGVHSDSVEAAGEPGLAPPSLPGSPAAVRVWARRRPRRLAGTAVTAIRPCSGAGRDEAARRAALKPSCDCGAWCRAYRTGLEPLTCSGR